MAHFANGSNYSDDELAEASHSPVIVTWSEEDRLFLAKLPHLGGLVVHGSTPEEALKKSTRSAAQYLAALRELGEAIPEPHSRLVAD